MNRAKRQRRNQRRNAVELDNKFYRKFIVQCLTDNQKARIYARETGVREDAMPAFMIGWRMAGGMK